MRVASIWLINEIGLLIAFGAFHQARAECHVNVRKGSKSTKLKPDNVGKIHDDCDKEEKKPKGKKKKQKEPKGKEKKAKDKDTKGIPSVRPSLASVTRAPHLYYGEAPTMKPSTLSPSSEPVQPKYKLPIAFPTKLNSSAPSSDIGGAQTRAPSGTVMNRTSALPSEEPSHLQIPNFPHGKFATNSPSHTPAATKAPVHQIFPSFIPTIVQNLLPCKPGHVSTKPPCDFPAKTPSVNPSRQIENGTKNPSVIISSKGPSQPPNTRAPHNYAGTINQPSIQQSKDVHEPHDYTGTVPSTVDISASPSDTPFQPKYQMPMFLQSPTKTPFNEASKITTNEPAQSPPDEVNSSVYPSITKPSENPASLHVPSGQPSAQETDKPSSKPSHYPTELKHFAPSEEPSNNSSALPSQETTSSPTTRPSAKDSSEPTMTPSGHQSAKPSSIPSKRASSMPSTLPSFAPQAFPSGIPTTGNLTNTPVNNLISFPSQLPSVVQGILLPPNSTRHDVILGILTPDVVSSTSLDDASSSASLAFEWIVNEDSSLEVDSDQTIQRFIMGKIFFQMNGDRWSTSTAGGHAGNNWMDASHECDWLNVLCDENNRITEILIEGSGVHGALVDEIDWLANLRHYKMNGNSITGTIPTQFGNLTRLEILRLEGNKLVGEIPMEIYNAVKLVEVNLGQNNLEGSISTLIGNLVNIETLDIATNEEMTGSLPSEMESLENIASLHIEATGLTGSVPSGVCDYLMSNDGKITSACGGAWVTFTCNCHVGTICCPLPV